MLLLNMRLDLAIHLPCRWIAALLHLSNKAATNLRGHEPAEGQIQVIAFMARGQLNFSKYSPSYCGAVQDGTERWPVAPPVIASFILRDQHEAGQYSPALALPVIQQHQPHQHRSLGRQDRSADTQRHQCRRRRRHRIAEQCR